MSRGIIMNFKEYLKEALNPKYAKGLTQKEKVSAEKEMEKNKNKEDDDPTAYKPLPSDNAFKKRGGKTKESKYTKAYKKKYKSESLDESNDKALSNKAKESSISKTILKQVFNRGMAAWKTGHRPGTTPQQWAFARVNSFITGGKTRTTADKDLWAKHKKKGKKKGKK